MAKKYHINDYNQVEICHAHKRKCPFIDYSDLSEARRDANAKMKRDSYQAEADRIRNILRESKAHTLTTQISFIDMNYPIKKFAEELKSFTEKNNKSPELIELQAILRPRSQTEEFPKFFLKHSSIKAGSVGREKIESEWKLEVINKYGNKRRYTINNENPIGSFIDVRDGLTRVYIQDPEATQKINELNGQLEQIYVKVEEQLSGPSAVTDKLQNSRHLTFKQEFLDTATIDQTYGETTFTPKLLERYAFDNKKFIDNHLKVDLKIGEVNRDNNGWRIQRSRKGDWSVYTKNQGENEIVTSIETSREAYDIIKAYNQKHRSEDAAEERANYASTLMIEIEDTIDFIDEMKTKSNADFEIQYQESKGREADKELYKLRDGDKRVTKKLFRFFT